MTLVLEIQDQVLEVSKNIPQERIRCITEQNVDASATVHAEIVEAIQLVRIAVEQIVAIPMTDHEQIVEVIHFGVIACAMQIVAWWQRPLWKSRK